MKMKILPQRTKRTKQNGLTEDHQIAVTQINAGFDPAPINDFEIIGEGTPEEGGSLHGIMRSGRGFARLAIDLENDTILLLAAKVPGLLQGDRPSDENLPRLYGIGARKIRPGALLPPDMVNFFIEKKEKYDSAIARYSATRFRFLAYRAGENEIYTNSRAAYIFEKRDDGNYDLRFTAPVNTDPKSMTPKGIESRWRGTLMQKYLAKGVTRAEAYDVFARHRQSLTSKFWDHVNIYKDEGPRTGLEQAFTKMGNYLRLRAATLAAGTIVAAVFLGIKDRDIGINLAGFAGAHALADVTVHSAYSRAMAKHREKKANDEALSLDNSGAMDDVMAAYLKLEPPNLQRPWPQLDPSRIKAENIRYLTPEELQGLEQTVGKKSSTTIRPTSLRGLALYGSQRGFTHDVMLPAPSTRIEMFQNGMIVLKHGKPDGRQLTFVTFKECASISDFTRLPEDYIEQIYSNDSQIQQIVTEDEDQDSIGHRAVSHEEMMKTLRESLYQTPSTPDNFQSGIAPEFQTYGLEFIESLFKPTTDIGTDQNADLNLFMCAEMPLLPLPRCIY